MAVIHVRASAPSVPKVQAVAALPSLKRKARTKSVGSRRRFPHRIDDGIPHRIDYGIREPGPTSGSTTGAPGGTGTGGGTSGNTTGNPTGGGTTTE